MASWNDLPSEIKSLILKHYVRTLLYSASCRTIYSIATHLPSDFELRDLITVAADLRWEIVRLAEEMKVEVPELLESRFPGYMFVWNIVDHHIARIRRVVEDWPGQ